MGVWLWLWVWVWASVCVGGLSRIGRAGRGQLGRRFEFLLLNVAEISAPRKFEGNKRFGLSKQAFPALSPFLPLRLLLLLLFLTIRGASSGLWSGSGATANVIMSKYFSPDSLRWRFDFCGISRLHSCCGPGVVHVVGIYSLTAAAPGFFLIQSQPPRPCSSSVTSCF